MTEPIDQKIRARAPVSMQSGLRQLFVDDHIIAETANLKRRLHQPDKDAGNPVLTPERPWEGEMITIYGSVIHDQDEATYKMWYQAFEGMESHENAAKKRRTCYATSSDGIHWERPNLGILEYSGSRANNIVFNHELQTYYGEVHNVIQDREDPDPQRRYKMTLCCGDGVTWPGSYFSATSPDGLHWTPTKKPIITYEGQTPDISHLVKDPISGKYRLYCRIIMKRPGVALRDPPECCGRAVGLMESEDFINWTTPEPVLLVDEDDPPGSDAHRMMVIPYEGMYLGVMEFYMAVPPYTNMTWQLTSSRDGRHWQRVADRATFLPAGGMGDWDPHFLSFSDVPIIDDQEMWFYYGGRRHWNERVVEPDTGIYGPHTGAIGRAKLRRDGFCSMDAPCRGGYLTTVPLLLPPGELHLNVKSDFGEARVEVVEADGGQRLASSDTVTVDSCDVVARFPTADDVPAWQSRPVRLQFHLKNANLFSFWVA